MNEQFSSIVELGLFTGKPQHDNFCRMATLLPSRAMAPSSMPIELDEAPRIDLPQTYEFGGVQKSVEDFFADTDTAALLVLNNGEIVYERYALTGGVDVEWLSMSVAKSLVSALVGIAVDEGQIGDIDEPISNYIAVDRGSAYDGVSIKNVLQMCSGARWHEDYSDPESDTARLVMATANADTLERFIASMAPDVTPGTLCRYNSADTEALGFLLTQATGRSVSDYMQEKLIEPLGMTSSSHWLIDYAGMEWTFGFLTMTARDFAKFGELYRNGGNWRGRQIVPRQWVRASLVPEAPHLQPGRPVLGGKPLNLGYGYQWWIPDGDRGEFSAVGVYNQFIYVDPASNVVIVKLSANRAYGTSPDEADNRDFETIAFLRAIASDSDRSG